MSAPKWRHIGSAPKDTQILLFGLCDGEINGKRDEPGIVVGQSWGSTFVVSEGDCYTVTVAATHWMPLPGVPK